VRGTSILLSAVQMNLKRTGEKTVNSGIGVIVMKGPSEIPRYNFPWIKDPPQFLVLFHFLPFAKPFCKSIE